MAIDMTDDFPSRSLDKIVVRVPDGMRDRIATAAKNNGRSVNAEIVQLLEMYYPPAPPADEVADLISGIFRISNGNPPKSQWNNLYSLLNEFHARLMRDKLAERYGEEAGR